MIETPDGHTVLPPPRNPIEYSLAEYKCRNPPGGRIEAIPGDIQEMRYCPFCGQEL